MPQTYEEKNWSTWVIQRKCKDKPIKFLTRDYGWTKYWEKAHQYNNLHKAEKHIYELQGSNREAKFKILTVEKRTDATLLGYEVSPNFSQNYKEISRFSLMEVD